MKTLARFALVGLIGLSAQSAFARVNTCADEEGGVYTQTHSINGCDSEEPFACAEQTALTCLNDKCAIVKPDLAKMTYMGTASEVAGERVGQLTAILNQALGGFLSIEEGAAAVIFSDKETNRLLACDNAPVSQADLERVLRQLN